MFIFETYHHEVIHCYVPPKYILARHYVQQINDIRKLFADPDDWDRYCRKINDGGQATIDAGTRLFRMESLCQVNGFKADGHVVHHVSILKSRNSVN